MARFHRMKCALVTAFLLCGVGTCAQPFTNGGFEIVSGAPIPSDTSRTVNPGDTWLTGWSAGGPVVVQNGSVGMEEGSIFFGLTPWQGQQWVIFPNDTPGGSLSQTFETS